MYTIDLVINLEKTEKTSRNLKLIGTEKEPLLNPVPGPPPQPPPQSFTEIPHSSIPLVPLPVQPLPPEKSAHETKKADDGDDPPPEKSVLQILSEFLHIFHLATPRDKFLLCMGCLSTVAHGLCFLTFALILGTITEPFIQQSIHGYNNDISHEESTESPIQKNFTRIFTKAEFVTQLKDYSHFYFAIAGAIFVFSLSQTYLWELAAENQCYELRKKFTDQILRQELPWFKTHNNGELCSRQSDGVEKVREGIGHKLSMVIQYATICCFQVGFALLTNWKLTMIFLTISPLPVLLAKFLNFGKLLARKGETEQQKYALATQRISDAFSNIQRIFAFGKENYEVERYRSALHDAAMCAINKYLVQSCGLAVFVILLFGSYAIAFQHACSILGDHSASIKDVYIVFFTVTIAVFALGQILPWISTIAAAQASSVVLEDILTLPPPTIDTMAPVPGVILPQLTGYMKFDNVVFAYPSDLSKHVLDNLTLEIRPGQNVGIIGYSGAGKTTLADMMFRFYDPCAGSVSVDNVDIRTLSVGWYRSKIAIVSQEIDKFQQGTIWDNIRAGRKDIGLGKIIDTAKLVGVHDSINVRPRGYHTEVGVSDRELTPEEKVQIALVRALVRDPLWLILDGCISDSDLRILLPNIMRTRKGLVTICIAHETKIVQSMDIIHVMENGQIVESGTYEGLLKLKGKFYKMYVRENTRSLPTPLGDRLCPDEDDELVIALTEQAKMMKQKYPGMLKMLRITNDTCSDWTLWGIALFGCLLAGLVVPFFAFVYTDIFWTFGETSEGIQTNVRYWEIMLIGLAGLAALGFLMRALFVQAAGEFMILKLRQLSFMSILARPLTWFETEGNSAECLSNKLADGVPFIKTALDNRFSIALSGIFSVITAIIVTTYLNWQFGVVLSACFLLILALAWVQIWAQRSHERIGVALLGRANLIFRGAVGQIKTIQALSQETDIRQRFTNLVYGYLIDRRKSCRIFAFMHAISETIVYLILGAVFMRGVQLIDTGSIEPIIFFRIFLILSFCLITFEHTMAFIPDYSKAELAFGRILDLIEGDEELELNRLSEEVPIPTWWGIVGAIKFEDVEYHRPDEDDLIFNSFQLPAGKTLAIVSENDDGDMFALLIMGFYKPSDGQVFIDGRKIQDIDLVELRTNIGYVPQKPNLIENASIFDNIAYGFQGKIAESDLKNLVWKVAIEAGLEQFITSLSNKLETLVNDACHGLRLLMKRKIAIARALIRDPRILLINDPTNGLDVVDEKEMEEVLQKVRVGKTCIITTANNLAIVKMADFVGFFERENLKLFGTIEELSADPNKYPMYKEFLQKHESQAGPSHL